MQFSPAIVRGFVCLTVSSWPHIRVRVTDLIERCRPRPSQKVTWRNTSGRDAGLPDGHKKNKKMINIMAN